MSALVSQRDYPKKPVPIQRELIAFADPVFGAEGPETPAAPAATYSPATQATLRGLDRSGANPRLNRLPHTADEVNDIAHLFTDQPAPYLRDAAQEHTAKDLAKAGTLQGLRYLIFATHGLLGGEFLQVKAALETQPMPIPDRPLPVLPKEERAQPALALTLVGNRLQGEDGFLTLQEVLDELPLNTDLVVLSACNTAGDPQRSNQGEGFAGLTRAFLFAGARHLLVSHWYVASDSTRDLMVATFTQLQAGQPPLDALTEARRQVRGRTWQPQATAPYVSLAHPYFWAPFVVVGD